MPALTYKELMKKTDVSSNSPLNRALQMNEELESMRKKNVSLYDQNLELTEINKELSKEREGLVQLVKSLNTELDQLKTSSVAKEKKLRADLKAMQASWDSLYDEHRAAEEKRKRELLLKNANSNGDTTEQDRLNQQAELLRSAFKKQSAQSDMVSPMEQKLHEMEAENKKLKSKVVQLQTKYKEEKYKNENRMNDNDDSASTTDSDSVSSEEKKPGVGLLAGFTKRKVGQRPTPKYQTKNLWGRMTSPRSARPEFEFSTINLAFSREE